MGNNTLKVIPDTSFFVYFLSDVHMPDLLDRLIRNSTYEFVLCKLVKDELRKGGHKDFLTKYWPFMNTFSYYDISEALRPFFSESEITKGEHEVIVAAYIYHHVEGDRYLAVIDDNDAREYVRKNFPEIFQNVTGTLGFIVKSYCDHEVISYTDAETAIMAGRNSKFRIKEEVLRNLERELIRCSEIGQRN